MRDLARQRRGSRRGASMTEFAIVLPIFLALALGMIDGGMAVFRSHLLSQAARNGARSAIVRGEYANKLGKLGPATFDGKASANYAIAESVRKQLVGVSPGDVDLKVEWIDGGNRVEQRVRVTVSTTYTPMITYVFGSPTWNLQASSTMPIAH